MRILITGGAGFIGSNFIHYFLRRYPDYSVINLDKLTYAGNLDNLKDLEKDLRYQFVKGDICDPKIVNQLAPKVDAIINFAAESHVDRSIFDPGDFILTDVYGVFVLLKAVKEHKIKRFVQISTDEVYGDIESGKYAKETDPLKPSSPYSASKAGGDLQVLAAFRTYKLPVLITRSTNNYGPYQYPEKIIPLFLTNAEEDKDLPLYDQGTQIRDWLYVEDNCAAIDLVLHQGEIGEIYNVGANQDPEVKNLELTKMILELLGKPESLIKPVSDFRPGHDQRYAVDCTKIKALGWKPGVSLKDGLKKTVTWYLKNRWWWEKIKSLEFYQKQYQR